MTTNSRAAPTLWLAMSAAIVANSLGAEEAKRFTLDIIWSTLITAPPPAPVGRVVIPEFGTGLVLIADTVSADGRTIFVGRQLAKNSISEVLLIDAERSGPQSAHDLLLAGALPDDDRGLSSTVHRLLAPRNLQTPNVVSVAVSPRGEIWVGGGSNFYRDIGSAPHSDAYLAKLDATARTLWEKSYGNSGHRSIYRIASLPTGDVVVVGREGRDAMWLARLDSDGRRLWERRIGNDVGAAVAALADDHLVVVGFAAAKSGPTNEDRQKSLVAWVLDGSGNMLTETRLRNDVDPAFADIDIVATQDAVYVASGSHYTNPSPVEISKLALDGRPLWHRTLSDTVAATKNVFTRVTCSPAMAIAPQEDIWVACALKGQIQIYRLDPSSGEYDKVLLPLPACHEARPAKLFLIARGDSMLLGGSRPSSNVGPSCSWIGWLTAVR